MSPGCTGAFARDLRCGQLSLGNSDVLQKSSFDAIVLDYDLPELNGIEFLKIIRAKGRDPGYYLHRCKRENAAIAALNNGANFFLKKGENMEMPFIELRRIIRHAVEQRFMGKAKGLSRKIVFDLVNFSLDAESLSIPREMSLHGTGPWSS